MRRSRIQHLVGAMGISLAVVMGGAITIAGSISEKTMSRATPGRFESALTAAGEWFLNNENEEFINYANQTKKTSCGLAGGRLRETAAAWALASLAQHLQDDRLLRLARKGLDFFSDHLAFDYPGQYYYLNMTPGQLKLGYSAFLILAMLELDPARYADIAQGLARGIQTLQSSHGKLRSFFPAPGEARAAEGQALSFAGELEGAKTDRTQSFYPGQALLALAQMRKTYGREAYQRIVEKAFPYYRGFWRMQPSSDFIPWQLQAYAKLYRIDPDPRYAEFIFEMADYLTSKYGRGDTCENYNFRSISAASLVEGINRAYEVARALNDEKRTVCYANFVREGLEVVLQLQIPQGAGTAPLMAGGFRATATADEVRVDHVQHAVMAILGAYENGLIAPEGDFAGAGPEKKADKKRSKGKGRAKK
ncbi:MAG: hypothetical protein ACOY3K_01155 [Candidatus Omnitrophota bacterium]